MNPVVRTLAALAALAAVGAGAVVGLGLYNTSARQGHLPGVSVILHTTFKQSVRLRAPATKEVPGDLNKPDRIALGAQHFQTACAFCHSTPGQPRSATARSMNPEPPHITEAVAQWDPRHLFWIVREGVKMSGMPHWPAKHRDDEVWSVVAYLDAVRSMTPDQQKSLTGGASGAASCAACHGVKGKSTNSFVPRLDLLTSTQITDALQQYRSGARTSGFMQEAAAPLTDAQILSLADKFGTQTQYAADTLPDIADAPLATTGSNDVPACTACHGPGRKADAPIAPALAGQSQDYLAAQLRLWREGHRGGGERAEVMRKAARALSDADIAALARWFAALENAAAAD